MNDLVISFIRTFTPIVVGGLMAFLASIGLELDEQVGAGFIVALTGVFQATYYALARRLEYKHNWIGKWLLGSSKAPSYED